MRIKIPFSLSRESSNAATAAAAAASVALVEASVALKVSTLVKFQGTDIDICSEPFFFHLILNVCLDRFPLCLLKTFYQFVCV